MERKKMRLYDILEIKNTATQTEIKQSYFKLAKEYHPDLNKTDQAKQKYLDITEAYETLGNEKNR